MIDTFRSILFFRTRSKCLRAGCCLAMLISLFVGCANTDSEIAGTLDLETEQTETINKPQQEAAAPTEINNQKEGSAKQTEAKQEVSPQSDANSPAAGQVGSPAEEEPRLLKTNTLLMLTYQADIRATKMVEAMRPFMTDEQAKRAKRLASTYDWRFKEILHKRAAILENASDDQDIKGMLFATRVETADLIKEIRGRISAEILTPEQRKQVHERYQED